MNGAISGAIDRADYETRLALAIAAERFFFSSAVMLDYGPIINAQFQGHDGRFPCYAVTAEKRADVRRIFRCARQNRTGFSPARFKYAPGSGLEKAKWSMARA
jgi:hypothetical protein